MNFYLDHYEMEVPGSSQEQSYGDEASDRAFKTTQIFAFLALIGCIVGLIGAALVMAEKAGKTVGAALIQLAVILCLISPLYLMFTLPGAIKEDTATIEEGGEFFSPKMGESFFGSDELDVDISGVTVKYEYNWGGSTGWFLPIIALIICIAAMVLVATSQPAPAAAPPQPAYPGSYPYSEPAVPPQQPYPPQAPLSQAPPPGAPPPSQPTY